MKLKSKTQTKGKTTYSGFTLIEMMVVVAIIGILTGIALPMYNDYVTRTRLSEPISELSAMKVKMEQFFQDNRTYAGSCTAGTVAPTPTSTTYFDYTCPTRTSTAFEVVATGKGAMLNFEYRINQDNTRTTTNLPTGWSGINSTCWVLRKSGTC